MSKCDFKIIHYYIGRLANLGLGLSYLNDIVKASSRKSLLYGAASAWFMLRAYHYNELLKEELY